MLFAWQRPTISWDLACEWDGTMDRKTAMAYYATTFEDAKQADRAETAAAAEFFVTVTCAACLLFMVSCAVFDTDKKESCLGLGVMLIIAGRIAAIITLSILFKRLNDSWDIT
jgi:hypothetical protein